MSNPAEDAAIAVAVRLAADNLGVAPQTLRVLSAIKRRRRSRPPDSAKVGWYFLVTVEAATGTQLTFRVFDSGEIAGPD